MVDRSEGNTCTLYSEANTCIMTRVRIGRRLTIVLWLVVTPVLATHAYWSIHHSVKTYVGGLKRETRAASRGLVPALENDIGAGEWDQVRDIMQRSSVHGTVSAIFSADGSLRSGLQALPAELLAGVAAYRLEHPEHYVEFETTAGGRHWFCHLAPLRGKDHQFIGYLLLARDWTELTEDLRAREIGSMIAALTVMAVVAGTISFFVRRYVSEPLATLSRKVMRFSTEAEIDRHHGGDEVNALTEEFRRLDVQLTQARADLLERHRRELELERGLERADRLATIGMLAAGLAHEIGTPMGVIRARAEHLLRSESHSPSARKALQIIIAQIDRISRVVRLLLDYGRGRESRRVCCDARAVIEDALALVETEAQRRKVGIIKELGEVPLMVECDCDQLQQVFVNLAMNALDAMAPDGGTLRIMAKINEAQNGPRLSLAFEDTGPGVPTQDQARVFDPFFTTKEPGRGTGMGLSVSQSIIRDHDGDIALISGMAGARFVVTLPITVNEGQALGAAAEVGS